MIPDDKNSLDERLAQAITHWQFGSREWGQFLEFDKGERQKHDTRAAFVLVVIIGLALLVCLFLSLGDSGASLPAVGALLIFASIVALTFITHNLIQGRRYQLMESTGRDDEEVYITPNGIWSNGVWFDWGDDTPWRLTTVTPVLADSGVRIAPGMLSYLEFKCRARAAGPYRVSVDKKWRVPVPRGKEDEAREVIRYFGKPSARRDEFGLPAD